MSARVLGLGRVSCAASDDGAAAKGIAAGDGGKAAEVEQIAELRGTGLGAQIAAGGDVDADGQGGASGGVKGRVG